jgi:hypothetical protein
MDKKIAAGVGIATAVGMVVGANMLFSPEPTTVKDFLPSPTMAEDYVPSAPVVDEETITATEPEAEAVQTQEQPQVTTEYIGPLPGEVEQPKPTITEHVKKTFSRFLPKKKEAKAEPEPRAKKIRREAKVRYANGRSKQYTDRGSLPLNGSAPNGVFAWELDRQIWTYRNSKNRTR